MIEGSIVIKNSAKGVSAGQFLLEVANAVAEEDRALSKAGYVIDPHSIGLTIFGGRGWASTTITYKAARS